MNAKRADIRVLLAPNAYKGTLSAPDAAACMREAVLREMPESNPVSCPIADGGDDTLAVLKSADPAFESRQLQVSGPMPGQLTPATYLYHPRQALAVVEAAQAHGIVKLPQGRLAPLEATSYGVGETMRQVMANHPGLKTLVVTLGGSASTDGGLGALQALGAAFYTAGGRKLEAPVAGRHLSDIEAIRLPEMSGWPEIVIATDVTNPLLGEQGTARIFAPQKGASPADCQQLEAGLQRVADILRAQRGTALETEPGTGAAGGLGYGLRQIPNSRIVSGFDWVASALDLPGKIRGSDVVVTGEGRLDATSLSGKGVGSLIRMASGRPVLIVCGDVAPDLSLPPNVQVFSMRQVMGSLEAAMTRPVEAMRAAMTQVLAEIRRLLPG